MYISNKHFPSAGAPFFRSLSRRAGRTSLVVVFILAVSGCAATGTKFSGRTPSQGKALIYVYRVGSILGGANSWMFYANDQAITDIGNGGYYEFEVDPGEVKIEGRLDLRFVNFIGSAIAHAAGRVELFRLHAEGGSIHYLKFKIGPKVTEVGKDEALRAMNGLSRFEDIRAKSNVQ